MIKNPENPARGMYSASVAEDVRAPMRAAAELCGVRQGDILAVVSRALMAGGPKLYRKLERTAAKATEPAA